MGRDERLVERSGKSCFFLSLFISYYYYFNYFFYNFFYLLICLFIFGLLKFSRLMLDIHVMSEKNKVFRGAETVGENQSLQTKSSRPFHNLCYS